MYSPTVTRTEIVLVVVRCGAEICLARRSQLVGTSRGLWSVVTGYLEPHVTPQAQASAELEEELGLRGSDVQLVRSLAPIELTSPTSGKEFRVYPFLYDCDASRQLVLNWEHDEVQWAQPERLLAPDSVGWQLPLVRALLT